MKNICSIVVYKLNGLVVKTIKLLQIHPDVFIPIGTEGTIQNKNCSNYYGVTFDFVDPSRGEKAFMRFCGKSQLAEYTKLVDDKRGQPEPEHRKCRICGCTQHSGCPGGCFWVEDNLCSSCDKLMTPKAREGKEEILVVCESPGQGEIDYYLPFYKSNRKELQPYVKKIVARSELPSQKEKRGTR